ncbi:hypothetical protein D3C75_468100 [compost metagenome]
MRVFDFHQVRRAVVLEPGLEAYAGQALGDELQLAVFAAGVVHLDQRAVERQGRGVEMARVFLGRVHVEQGQGVVIGFADQIEGFGPRFFVDDDRQHLGREERSVMDRDDVDLVRQVLARQGQAFARFVLLGVFRIGVFARVFGEFLLVAHGGTCAMGMGLRWGRLAVVSTVIFCDAVFRRCVQQTDRLAEPWLCAVKMWERACSRKRCARQHLHCLTHRFREQARSHRGGGDVAQKRRRPHGRRLCFDCR